MNKNNAKAEHKSTFDELIDLTKSYRNSSSYFQFIKFISKIKNYSAYNVALIYAQNPNITYVASKTDWAKRHRRVVIPEASPLIILAPFHPVLFVFDVSDTEGEQLPDRVFAPFWAKGEVPDTAIGKLYKFCKRFNVVIKEVAKDINSAGLIKTDYVDGKFESYLMEINTNHTAQVKFSTLIHELAHLLCGHLGIHSKNDSWRKRNNLSLSQVEFEAESVSYIICQRFGIRSNAEEYLSGYMGEHSVIPDISIDTILHVAGAIENAVKGITPAKTKQVNEKDSNAAQQLDLF